VTAQALLSLDLGRRLPAEVLMLILVQGIDFDQLSLMTGRLRSKCLLLEHPESDHHDVAVVALASALAFALVAARAG
jgi:hypothetical protein